MRGSRARNAIAAAIALAVGGLGATAAACMCRPMDRNAACKRVEQYFSGVVEAVEVGGTTRRVTVRTVTRFRGQVPDRVSLSTPGGTRELSSCDPGYVPRPGEVARFALWQPGRLTACDRVEPLRDHAAARQNPCQTRRAGR